MSTTTPRVVVEEVEGKKKKEGNLFGPFFPPLVPPIISISLSLSSLSVDIIPMPINPQDAQPKLHTTHPLRFIPVHPSRIHQRYSCPSPAVQIRTFVIARPKRPPFPSPMRLSGPLPNGCLLLQSVVAASSCFPRCVCCVRPVFPSSPPECRKEKENKRRKYYEKK